MKLQAVWTSPVLDTCSANLIKAGVALACVYRLRAVTVVGWGAGGRGAVSVKAPRLHRGRSLQVVQGATGSWRLAEG